MTIECEQKFGFAQQSLPLTRLLIAAHPLHQGITRPVFAFGSSPKEKKNAKKKKFEKLNLPPWLALDKHVPQHMFTIK